MEPRIIIHAGAGKRFKDPARGPIVRASLRKICALAERQLNEGASARDVVREACVRLEDDPNFNAGTGSVVQSDGQVRMSASMMDGPSVSFSAVINAMRIKNAIELADVLQGHPDRVLDGNGVELLAREMGLSVYDPIVGRRLEEWLKRRGEDPSKEAAHVVSEGSEPGMGTVGAVALDHAGNLAAATSTGGRGFERLGRVSDCGTPAGNYATEQAAISCTGIGEDILDECLGPRVMVRVTDGLSLRDAMKRSIDESIQRSRRLAAIAISADGSVVWGKTTQIMLACWHDGRELRDSIDADEAPEVALVVE